MALHRLLRAALITAIFLYFAAPLVLAGEGNETGGTCGSRVHSRVVRSAVVLLKEIAVDAARAERAVTIQAARSSLEMVAVVTPWLDRLGFLKVTVHDTPGGNPFSDSR